LLSPDLKRLLAMFERETAAMQRSLPIDIIKREIGAMADRLHQARASLPTIEAPRPAQAKGPPAHVVWVPDEHERLVAAIRALVAKLPEPPTPAPSAVAPHWHAVVIEELRQHGSPGKKPGGWTKFRDDLGDRIPAGVTTETLAQFGRRSLKTVKDSQDGQE
jgi:hypothetical protein